MKIHFNRIGPFTDHLIVLDPSQASSQGLYKLMQSFDKALEIIIKKYEPLAASIADTGETQRFCDALSHHGWNNFVSMNFLVQYWALITRLVITFQIGLRFDKVEWNESRVRLLSEDNDLAFILEVWLCKKSERNQFHEHSNFATMYKNKCQCLI